MTKGKPDFTELLKELEKGQRKILILTHRNPDGDAIGSSLGLYHVLKELGHTVNILVPNRFPAFLNWMPSAGDITVYNYQTERAVRLLKEAEMLFALDFNDLSRVREFETNIDISGTYRVLIDHHPHPANFAHFTYSDTTVSSTAEMVYNFVEAAGLMHLFSKDAAACIYAGILTDTGCFSFNSSQPYTFRIVARLLELGIDKDTIYDKIYDNFSFDRMRLMGHCLDQNMHFLPEYHTAYITLSQEEMKKYNFRIGDSEGFVNLPLSIAEVSFSVLISEQKDVVKLSFRSKGSFPVNQIASEYFDGGGHVNAAGGESKLSLQDTVTKFLEILPQYKDALQG